MKICIFSAIAFIILMNFIWLKGHVFIAIMWLEVISLLYVVVFITSPILKVDHTPIILMFFMAIIVTEASLALARIIVLSRSNSNLNTNNITQVKC